MILLLLTSKLNVRTGKLLILDSISSVMPDDDSSFGRSQNI